MVPADKDLLSHMVTIIKSAFLWKKRCAIINPRSSTAIIYQTDATVIADAKIECVVSEQRCGQYPNAEN